MKKKQTGKSPSPVTRAEALNCRPVRNPEIRDEVMESGDVLIVYPVRTKPWFVRLARRMGWDPDKPLMKKLQLDELGTVVWRLIDGKKSVREIVKAFAGEYQLHTREAEISVTTFIRELGKRGIIGLK